MKKQCFKKRLIGLTGGIASGKSTVLDLFKRQGATVLSADELVHELYQTLPVRRQLEKWFGSAQKEKVAQAVFAREDNRKKVERFLHPLVWKLAQRRLAKNPKNWALFEVPLLFEAGWDRQMDLTVVVAAAPDTLAARLKARGLTRRAYQQRKNNQWKEQEKIRRADVVLVNDTTKRQLAAKVKRLYRALETIYA